MNSTSSFSYDFQVKRSSNEEQDSELFALDQVTEFHLPKNSTLVRNPRNGKKMVLPDEVMSAMTYCASFRTMEEHVAHLMEGNDGSKDKEKAITSIVQSVRKGGLTLSARDICAKLTPDEAGTSVAQIPVVVIITCERPKALKRLLESFVAICDLTQVKQCFIVDDSRLEDNQSRNSEITQRFNEMADIEISYFGEKEARDLVKTLIQRLPKYEEQIHFLIGRKRWKDYFSVGVARNYSHLLSVGSPVIVFDDDTICRAYEAPFPDSGLEFSTRQKQAHFYKLQDEKQYPKSGGDPDPIKRHMRCLGLSVPEALNVLGSGTPEQDSLRHAQPAFAARLGGHSRILVTECGSLGDPGTPSNKWLATIPAKSRKRLLEVEGQLEIALSHRNCWLGVDRPTFRPGAIISQVTGFDNRDFLPPYFPIERGEDRVFGNTVNFIFPNSVCLNYPWAAPHLPIPAREWPKTDNGAPISTRFPGKLTLKITEKNHLCQAEDPYLRLEYLGQLFRDMANSSLSSIINLHAENWLENKTTRLSRLHSTLEESAGAPQPWIDYLQQAIQHTQKASFDKTDPAELKESTNDLKGDELIAFWQATWDGFGRALPAWPDIRLEAKTIIDEQFPGTSSP